MFLFSQKGIGDLRQDAGDGANGLRDFCVTLSRAYMYLWLFDCSERQRWRPCLKGLQCHRGHGVLGVLLCLFFRSSESCREDGFWVHNQRPSPGGMRAAGCRKAQSNGTQNTLQGAQIKGCSPGLQIRPRRFDSGFGLHIRKPRRSRSAGFFIGRRKVRGSETLGGGVPKLFHFDGLAMAPTRR